MAARELLSLDENTPQIVAPQAGDTIVCPITLQAATGNEIAYDFQYTVNKATSGNDTGIVLNRIDTSSPGTSLLFDWQVGGVSKASITALGGLNVSAGSPTAPAIEMGAAGSGDGIYSSTPTLLNFSTGGVQRLQMGSGGMYEPTAGGSRWQFEATSATNPVFLPGNDLDTGLGSAGADQLSMIAGGVEGIRLTEDGGIYQTLQANIGITAYATGGQAGAAQLTSSFNVVATVGTTGDSVKLPLASPGIKVTIFNEGANAMDVFPNTSDTLSGGAADTAVSLAAGSNITYFAIDATNWEVL